ncbi:TonB-dependent receptor [Niabella insulamsoli]|uniref:SusC/RagA family TonB-linked outer membrane protein n=1 Tax=Niabella insulamsoli TaxID=3144874 RepID=UPI0031FDB476
MKRKLPDVFVGLLVLGSLLTTALPASAQAPAKKRPLAAVLKQISKNYNAEFVYNPALLEGKAAAYDPAEARGRKLEDLLKAILYPHDLVFLYVRSNYYTIVSRNQIGDVNGAAPTGTTPAPANNSQDQQLIRGKVVNENNAPLAQATVNIKGTSNSVQTAGDGSFAIRSINPYPTLIVSFVGYTDQEVSVTGTAPVTIQMTIKSEAMEQVVVVGYGTQRKSDVTGAVVSANLEDFKNAPNANIAQSLQGTVPGLNIGQVTSAGSTPSINIRGANTISGNNSVLIVLDGVQYNGSLESINPDDIASIDVLKDASATAVYGAQAANGVLLVTTRKGRKGQPRVSLSASYATQTPTVSLRPMRYAEYLDHVRQLYYNEAFLAPGYTQPNPDFDLAAKIDATMKDEEGRIVTREFDWWDEATNPGFINDNQLSISGASDKVNYLLSGGYTNQSGFIINDKFKRKSLRINLELQATDWWKIGVQSFGSFVDKDGAEPRMSSIIQQSPLITPYDEQGNLKPFPFNTNYSNPFLTYDVEDYERHNYLFANLYSDMNIPFIKGLNYRINFGNNYRINEANRASEYDAGLAGGASKDFNTYYDYTFDNILTYKKAFAAHDLTGTLLYGAIERKNSYTLAEATGFSRLTLGYNSLEQGTNQYTSSNAWREALSYQMFRINYKYANKYLLTATVRRDGFSGFAANHKYGYFPSVALGWVVSEASFFKPSWVRFLKLRAGYGISGNQTSRYNSLSRISSQASYVFGDGGSTLFGQQVNSLPSPDLRWERTAGLNIGVDFRLLDDRLNGAIDYYNNLTSDLLYSVNIPGITGFSSINSNVGELQNKGLELMLTSRNVETKDFRWGSTLTFSLNRNKINKLVGLDADGDGREDDLVASGLFIGHSLNSVFDYLTNGIYQIGDSLPAGYYPGNYRVVDRDQNGAINLDDRAVIGTRDPAYRVGLLNNFEYKGFSLNVFFNAIQGGKNMYLGGNSPTRVRDDNAIRYNYLEGIDYWYPLNPGGKYAQSLVAGTLSPTVFESRSFIRLQDISLSYRIKGGLMERLRIQNLNVYVSGKNLATWTRWDGWDPETNQGLTINGRPVMKSYAAGINLTF